MSEMMLIFVVFVAIRCTDVNLAVLRDGCFAYFELGGDRVAGPVGLLSA